MNRSNSTPHRRRDSSTVLKIATCLLILIALVAFGAAGVILKGPRQPKPLVGPPIQAAVFSVRRLPEALRLAVARQRLGTAIDATLTDPALKTAIDSSCVVIEIGGGIVASLTPKQNVLPASTMKTLTAAAVLARIDPSERFVTEVRAQAPPINGVLTGDLWLVGGGDPLLETTEYTQTQSHDKNLATSFDDLVAGVLATGVTQVKGGVVGDARRYDEERVRATWKKNYVSDGEVGPLGGLMVDDNFTVTNRRDKRVAATNVPADAAQLLRSKLEAAGVKFGAPSIGADSTKPKAAQAAPLVLTSVSSVPVAEVVREMLAWSDNTTAEMLVKELGFRTSGIGSWAEGLAAIKSSLQGQGVSIDGLTMIDGSGLDRSNRVTCDVLLSTIRSQRVGGAFFSGMAVMGEYGTLRKRLRGTAAQGLVHAKTGSLNGVSALAGFAQTADKTDAHFAIVFNGLASTADGVRAGNAIAESIVAFPNAPELAEFSLPGQVPEPKPVRKTPALAPSPRGA